MPTTPDVKPLFTQASVSREQIRNKAVDALKNFFPVQTNKYSMHVEDVAIHPQTFSSQDQKQALLEKSALTEPIKGKLVIKDAQGNVIDKSPAMTLLNLPWFTPRHTFIMDGNEYSVANQIRLLPGVYTRRRGNNEIETQFNVAKGGGNFRMNIEPETGVMHMDVHGTNVPLYPVLRALGISHTEIAKNWGHDLAEVNAKGKADSQEKAVAKLYGKAISEFKQTATNHDERVTQLKEHFTASKMDPNVVKKTLGLDHSFVQPSTIMAASTKLLNVFKSGQDTDDRESLEFKKLHTAEDFIAERINISGRDIRRKLMGKMDHPPSGGQPLIKQVVPVGLFSRTVKEFLMTSDVASLPTQYNPLEVIDSAVRVTPLGEGGIGDARAVPTEVRQLHPSHMGIIDPIKTTEGSGTGADVRATVRTGRDSAGKMYARMYNVRTKELEYVPVSTMSSSVVAFAGQDVNGTHVDAMQRGELKNVLRKDVDYVMPHAASTYSPATNMLPFIESMQGNRTLMAAKHTTQALNLKEKEVPLVQVSGYIPGQSMEHILGTHTLPTSPVDGKITKIDSHYIYVQANQTKKADINATQSVFRYNKAAQRKPEHILPPDVVARMPRQSLGTIGHYTVYLINGKFIRDNVDIDFIAGGHPCRYGYVPDNELWIEGGASERGATALHEYLEAEMMASGMSYDDAHEKAALVESVFRTARQDGTLEDVKEWLRIPEEQEKVAAILDVTKLGEAEEDEGHVTRIPYDTNFPLATKTFMHHDLQVKAGDTVKKDQTLAQSNWTKDGTFALGKNLNVAVMAYRGMNSNDAIVISEGAAKKLTSVHTYKEQTDIDSDTLVGKERHRVQFGNVYTQAQYAKLDNDGCVTKGTKVMYGDPLFALVKKAMIRPDAALLGKLHKSLLKPYMDRAHLWEHHFEGEVIDVVKTPRIWSVTVKTEEPMQIGDKLSGRHGNKGVVSAIIPDNKIIHDATGNPVDVIYTSLGVISRINPSQTLEMAVAKVAQKQGKPIQVDQFPTHSNVEWAKKLLKDNGVSDKETVFDPETGKSIKGVMVGPQYMYKLMKTTSTNFAARGVTDYDVNEQPSKGGVEGAKGLGRMEVAGLVAHGARNILKENSLIRSQRNDEFWKNLQLGLPPPAPKTTFAYNKFGAMITGSGVKMDKTGNMVNIGPLTDKDIKHMSSGVVTEPLMLRAKDLKPEEHGLFDPVLTGGTQGEKWSHIELHEPIVNPIFHDTVRRLLGMTGKELDRTIAEKGGAFVKSQLKDINLKDKKADLLDQSKTARGPALDSVVKQLKAISGLEKQKLAPHDAYVISNIPVVPPRVRPIMPGPSGGLLTNDANYLYRDLMLANDKLKSAKYDLGTQEHIEQARTHLHDATSALFGLSDPVSPQNQSRGVKGFLRMIAGEGSPKTGYFQANLIKRQYDLSARATIAPDASLGMEEVGVPESMLWTIFGPFVVARLIRRGFPATRAKALVDDKSPLAREELLKEAKERPVIYNRAPSLHRFNLIAAYPRPIPGHTIRIPTTWSEPAMNADFDGDTMQIHTPVGAAAVADAKKMTLPNLLFADKSKDKLYVIPWMESLAGMYKATSQPLTSKKARKFKNRDEAMAAYRHGEISLNDPVEVE